MGGDDAEKLPGAVFRRIIQDDILEIVHMGAFPPGGVHAAEDGLLVSVPRPRSRRSSSSKEGGAIKTSAASG